MSMGQKDHPERPISTTRLRAEISSARVGGAVIVVLLIGWLLTAVLPFAMRSTAAEAACRQHIATMERPQPGGDLNITVALIKTCVDSGHLPEIYARKYGR